jgi:hypothetical protein
VIASNRSIIAEEQAFVKRCGECGGDDIGSRLICASITDRLMRLYLSKIFDKLKRLLLGGR